MSSLKFSKTLIKAIADVSFRPKLASWDNTLSTAQIAEDEFLDWQIDQSSKSEILLFSQENKEALRVCYNKLAYTNEKSNDISKFSRFLKNASSHFSKNNVDNYSRIGYRQIVILKTELKLVELAEILFEKFYGSRDHIQNISGDVQDTSFTVDGKKGEYLNTCKIGPMKKDQIIKTFGAVFEIEKDKLSKDDTYLYVDIDVYKNNPEAKTLIEFRDEFSEIIEQNEIMKGAYVDLIEKI